MRNYSVKIFLFGRKEALVTYRNVTKARAQYLFACYVQEGFTLGRCIYVSKGNSLVVGYGHN